MQNSLENWRSLFECGGCLEPLRIAAFDAVEAVCSRTPGACGLFGVQALEDMRSELQDRLFMLYLSPLSDLLTRQMGQGAFIAEIVLAQTPGDEAIRAVSELGRRINEDPEFFSSFPLLKPMKESLTENFVSAMEELALRYDAFREEISARFFGGKPCGKVLSLSHFQTGNLKQHGRSVVCLETEAGRVFYKPHDCRIDEFFSDFTKTYLSDITAAPGVISGAGFAFCTELKEAPLSSQEELPLYFYRYGALTAVYSCLNGIDFHKDNVLACGAFPCAIDLENLLMPRSGGRDHMTSTAAERLARDSVDAMGVLPCRKRLKIFLSSALHRMAGSNRSLPVLDGETRDVTGFEEDYIRGFHDGYLRMLSVRDQIPGMLAALGGLRVRHLYTSPFIDLMLMRKIREADCLKSEEKQRAQLARSGEVLRRLGTPVSAELLEYGADCLREGDLPYYYIELDDRALFGADGQRLLEDAFAETPMEGLRRKLSRLSEADLAMEEKLIRWSFEHAPFDEKKPEPCRLPEETPTLTQEELRGEVAELFEKLEADCISAADGTRFWKSPALEYSGEFNCGQASLQAEAALFCIALLKKPQLSALHGRAEAMLEGCMEAVSKKISVLERSDIQTALPGGLSFGYGALICAAALFEGRRGESGLTDRLIRLLAGNAPCKDNMAGLADGCTGLIAALCSIPQRADREAEAIRLAQIARLSEKLDAEVRLQCSEDAEGAEAVQCDPLTGLAGRGLALALASKALGIPSFAESSALCFERLAAAWDEKACGWLGKSSNKMWSLKGPFAAGIGLCAAGALNALSEPLSAPVRRCLGLALRSERSETELCLSDSLENGNALRAVFLRTAAEFFPNEACGELAERVLGAMISRKKASGNYRTSADGVRNSFDASLSCGSLGAGSAILSFMI